MISTAEMPDSISNTFLIKTSLTIRQKLELLSEPYATKIKTTMPTDPWVNILHLNKSEELKTMYSIIFPESDTKKW